MQMRKICSMFIVICLFLMPFNGCSAQLSNAQQAAQAETVHIAVAINKMAVDTDNFYTNWLEEQSGLQIELTLIDFDYMPEYLRLLFSSDQSDIDAVFFQPNCLTMEELDAYTQTGKVIALDSYIEQLGKNLHAATTRFPDYRLDSAMTASDGKTYYMPNINYSAASRNLQTLWMNTGWLASLSVPMPQTTEDFAEVMRRFKNDDPNKNGQQDEMPLMGSFSQDNLFLPYFIMNAFVYTDPANAFLFMEDGKIEFAPITEEWREGLRYCKGLYDEGLLTNDCFDYDRNQLIRAANDSRNLVGAFTSESITDVIFDSSPEMLNEFTHIPPLKGPKGIRNAVVKTPQPFPGGMITANCKNPEAVFKLMDFMLSEEAFLVAAYGEENVDWRWAEHGDLSLGGIPASIVVINRSPNNFANKTLLQAGPFLSYPDYTDSVAWSGFQTDHWYMNARAARAYLPFESNESLPLLHGDDTLNGKTAALENYVKANLRAFVTGKKNLESDEAWQHYLDGFKKLELNAVLNQAEQSFIRNGGRP